MPGSHATFDAHAVTPVAGAPHATTRDATQSQRSFAELLAEAEAVRDYVELSRRSARWGGVQGAIQGAAQMLSRGMPWLGLPLLQRRPGTPRRGD